MSRSENILVRGPKNLDELVVALSPAGVVATSMTEVSQGMLVIELVTGLQVFVGSSDLEDSQGFDLASWPFEIGFESSNPTLALTAARRVFTVLAKTTTYELAFYENDYSKLLDTAGTRAA